MENLQCIHGLIMYLKLNHFGFHPFSLLSHTVNELNEGKWKQEVLKPDTTIEITCHTVYIFEGFLYSLNPAAEISTACFS